jgi:hypothetical protein
MLLRTATGKEAPVTEQQRKAANAERLKLIDPSIRPKVAAVIRDLERQSLKPLIDKHVFRTPAEQAELVRQGFSQVRWGFHNAQRPNGKPGSLAADIVDARLFWDVKKKFWLQVGASALKHGLEWGGMFDVPRNLRPTLRQRLLAGDLDPRLKIGWDPAHVQTARVSIAEAKQGKR